MWATEGMFSIQGLFTGGVFHGGSSAVAGSDSPGARKERNRYCFVARGAPALFFLCAFLRPGAADFFALMRVSCSERRESTRAVCLSVLLRFVSKRFLHFNTCFMPDAKTNSVCRRIFAASLAVKTLFFIRVFPWRVSPKLMNAVVRELSDSYAPVPSPLGVCLWRFAPTC